VTGFRPPIVAGVSGGVGTTTLALALHGRDAGTDTAEADVLVCRSSLESLDRASRIADLAWPGRYPVLFVTLDSAERRPPARLARLGDRWTAVVPVPHVARWRELVDPYREAAGLLGSPRGELPRTVRSLLDAVARAAHIVADSGRLSAPAAAPPAPSWHEVQSVALPREPWRTVHHSPGYLAAPAEGPGDPLRSGPIQSSGNAGITGPAARIPAAGPLYGPLDEVDPAEAAGPLDPAGSVTGNPVTSSAPTTSPVTGSALDGIGLSTSRPADAVGPIDAAGPLGGAGRGGEPPVGGGVDPEWGAGGGSALEPLRLVHSPVESTVDSTGWGGAEARLRELRPVRGIRVLDAGGVAG
jgi:hypothetical protein